MGCFKIGIDEAKDSKKAKFRGAAWVQCTGALNPLKSLHVYKNWTRVKISTGPVLLCTGPNPFPKFRCNFLSVVS